VSISKRVLVLAFGACLLAVVTVFFKQREPASVAPEISASAAPPVADGRSEELAPPGTETTPSNAEPVQPQAPLPTAPMVTPLMELARNRQEPPAQLVNIEREFLAEGIDTAWGPTTEASALRKMAEEPGLRLLNLQVECRTTQCRVLLGLPRGGGAEPLMMGRTNVLDFLNGFGMKPRFIWVNPLGPDAFSVVTYLQRPGMRAEPLSLVPPTERDPSEP
jgi:hypothetical protein